MSSPAPAAAGPAESAEAWRRRVGWTDDLVHLALKQIKAAHSTTCSGFEGAAYFWGSWYFSCPDRCLVISHPFQVLGTLAKQLNLFSSESKNLAQVYRLPKGEHSLLKHLVDNRWNVMVKADGLFVACYTPENSTKEYYLVWGQGRSIWYQDENVFQLFKETFVR
jgi:hypothetical protein